MLSAAGLSNPAQQATGRGPAPLRRQQEQQQQQQLKRRARSAAKPQPPPPPPKRRRRQPATPAPTDAVPKPLHQTTLAAALSGCSRPPPPRPAPPSSVETPASSARRAAASGTSTAACTPAAATGAAVAAARNTAAVSCWVPRRQGSSTAGEGGAGAVPGAGGGVGAAERSCVGGLVVGEGNLVACGAAQARQPGGGHDGVGGAQGGGVVGGEGGRTKRCRMLEGPHREVGDQGTCNGSRANQGNMSSQQEAQGGRGQGTWEGGREGLAVVELRQRHPMRKSDDAGKPGRGGAGLPAAAAAAAEPGPCLLEQLQHLTCSQVCVRGGRGRGVHISTQARKYASKQEWSLCIWMLWQAKAARLIGCGCGPGPQCWGQVCAGSARPQHARSLCFAWWNQHCGSNRRPTVTGGPAAKTICAPNPVSFKAYACAHVRTHLQ